MRIAVAQFDPASDPTANAGMLSAFADDARQAGARLLVCPEGSNTNFITEPRRTIDDAQPLDGPFGTALVAASSRGIAVAAGTFVPDGATGKVHNTLVIADHGEIVATYHKLHLYDAFAVTESDTVTPGADTPPVIDLDGVKIGFATCYDLRFPELFRVQAQAGADVLALPSAWVAGPVKQEHWLTLLKARAIENTAYVVAADQVGRKTIGRSAAFDPAGLPLLDLGAESPGFGVVDIDLDRIAEVRRVLPSGGQTRFAIDPTPR